MTTASTLPDDAITTADRSSSIGAVPAVPAVPALVAAGPSTADQGCFGKGRKINWLHLDCIERPLSQCLARYSVFISRHPWPFIIFPLLITGAMSLGFMHRNEITDATYLYTPVHARSKYERSCIHEKWPLTDGKYIPGMAVSSIRECQSIVTASDGGSILRPDHASAVIQLNMFIVSKVNVSYNGRTYNYIDLCMHWDAACWTNVQVGLISTVFNNPDPSFSNLTYPTSRFGDQSVYLGSSLGGVITDKNENIISAQAWVLLYQLQFLPENISYITGLWELELERSLLAYNDPLLKVTVFHSQTLARELKRNGEQLMPRFSVAIAVLVAFACTVTTAMARHDGKLFVDWTVSKPLLALLGVFGSGLGVVSSIGVLGFCDYVYNDIVLVMPFLIIPVGLDGCFLLINAIRHTSRSLSVEERVSEAMTEVATAIVITLTADFFSFMMGVTASIPAVRLFCVHTAVSIVMTFFYQLTFFLAVLILAVKTESESGHSWVPCLKTVPPEESFKRNIFIRLFNTGTRVAVRAKNAVSVIIPGRDNVVERDAISRWFQERYAPFIMLKPVRILILITFCLYLGIACWLCSQVHQGLDVVKLLVDDSYAIPHYRSLENYFWRNGSVMQIAVNNAQNLALPEERARVDRLVAAMTNTEHTMDEDSIQFWLYDFKRSLNNDSYWQNATEDPVRFYEMIKHYLGQNSNAQKREMAFWKDVEVDGQMVNMVVSFRFAIGLKHFETTDLQIETVNLVRSIAAQPDLLMLNVTTFNPVWLFVDQFLEILPSVVQEVTTGMCFMIVIALLLIPHPMVSFWVAVTIISVDVGVVGFMTIWGINLDTISMITLIMSIGYSVDFAAYTAHAFVTASHPNASKSEKVKGAMGEIAWPIIQGGLSTVLGVLLLADLNSYMVVAFFKTVFLVIVLALIHGLVFLPVLLSVFVPNRCGKKKRKRRVVRDTTQTMPSLAVIREPTEVVDQQRFYQSFSSVGSTVVVRERTEVRPEPES